ncbi:MAG: alanine--tRNA ligase [Flavobacteriaceae bacterium]
MTSQEIRKQFLDFFNSKQHEIVPSAPIVIKNDPTLMFTNAGMNQFKEYFLGQKEIKNSRVTDSQKCLRVSGKHNDLEEVGIDTYHHTMFEMLGNWSFGDYFKKEAISWAWELLTEVYKIDKESLYVSVFEGSKDADNLALDQEALDLWKAIVPEDKIIYGNKKDNFWEMGAQGPCGPCSEIHVDIRSEEEKAKVPGRDLVNMDHPEVIEVWNLVFMQYNRKADGSLENLPAKHVDTGMGFERLCMVLQGVQSNYDTDVFTPLINQIQKITNASYGKDWDTDVAIRVIADHLRAVAFAIADGQLPSNNGAGYVIRRILRRAIRYGFTFLGQKDAFIYKLIETLDRQMGDQFPELRKQKDLISKVIQEEELSFLRTLGQGLSRLDAIIEESQDKKISGVKAFELYDTFGFPLDLTSLILREKELDLDEEGFKVEMQKQKSRSRAASQMDMEDWVVLDGDKTTEFVGYDESMSEAKIIQYRKVVSKKDGELFQLVLDKTPFYPEGGGQVGDRGILIDTQGNKTPIINTKKENNLILHFTKVLPSNPEGVFAAEVNLQKRKATENNHSATHLLHHALREVLGTHVEQKGSLVNEKYLRFDFSHFSKVTEEELEEIETRVNQVISANLPLVEHRSIPMQEALDRGAMALFGEKYGDSVRMIEFGDSAELCGGTHVSSTGVIWALKISSESAVAAGIRRIEAITGDAARAYFNSQDQTVLAIKTLVKNNQPTKAIEQLLGENAKLKKEIEALLKEKAAGAKDELKSQVKKVGEINFLACKLNLDPSSIKDLAFQLGGEIDNLFFICGSENNGKALLTCLIDKKLVEEKGLDAGNVVRTLGKLIQGGGGGQKFFATAGGKNPKGIDQALEEAINFVS